FVRITGQSEKYVPPVPLRRLAVGEKRKHVQFPVETGAGPALVVVRIENQLGHRVLIGESPEHREANGGSPLARGEIPEKRGQNGVRRVVGAPDVQEGVDVEVPSGDAVRVLDERRHESGVAETFAVKLAVKREEREVVPARARFAIVKREQDVA